MRLTSDTSSQTPPTDTATVAATTAAGASPGIYDVVPSDPAAPPFRGFRSNRILWGLLAFVVLLLGTNAYSHSQNRAYQVSTSVSRCRTQDYVVDWRFSSRDP